MKYLLVLFIAFNCLSLQAQELHDAFTKDAELEASLKKYDLSAFVSEPVNFICDTVDKTATAQELNVYLNLYLPRVKNSIIRKASETNNGFVQTYGLYKQEDALYYIVLKLNPLSGKLEEVVVEKNR